jgi:hypothetical protein
MFFPKCAPNGILGVDDTLAYVAQNGQWHIPSMGFPWTLLWLLPSVHQLFEYCSHTYYPWDTPIDKNLGGSSLVNRHLTSFWCKQTLKWWNKGKYFTLNSLSYQFSPLANENYHRFMMVLQAFNLISLSPYATDLYRLIDYKHDLSWYTNL